MNKLLLCSLIPLAGLGLSTSVRAAECTEITAVAQTISSPGHYCLGADLATGQTGITINASHVDLDCRGYELRSTNVNSAQNTYGVYINNQTDVHVHHCHITGGHAAGIYAYQDNGLANANRNLSFHDNTISNVFWFGILAYGTSIDIRDNIIDNIGGRASFAMGIRVGGSNLASERKAFNVRGNVVRDVASPINNGYGIYANNSTDSSFVDNVITNTRSADTYGQYGIRVVSGTNDKITGNQISGVNNGYDYGIWAPATDACYDNHLRTNFTTTGCDASLGNF